MKEPQRIEEQTAVLVSLCSQNGKLEMNMALLQSIFTDSASQPTLQQSTSFVIISIISQPLWLASPEG
jgi:hypothetical protein